MDVQVEARTQRSLEPFSAWPPHNDFGTSGRVTVSGSSAATIPRSAFADLSLGDAFWELEDTSGEGSSRTSSSASSPSLDAPGFTFSPKDEDKEFDFPLHASNEPFQRTDKRCRHRLDVDGPNTADLSCKKRRLRVQLITSRLSQPYSQPATHILNREGMKTGDRRFAKIATSLDVARRLTHLQATSFLRFSVMNRLRRRFGLGPPGESYDHDGKAEGKPNNAMCSASQSSWKSQSLPAASNGQYLRSFGDPLSEPSVPGSAAPRLGSKMQNCWLSQPAALPVPPDDLAAARKRTTSRIHPVRSPDMGLESGTYDEVEEDSFAYLHIDDEDSGDTQEDSEHVYSDFSVIFGESAPSEEDHSYEEYLDELDGITWVSL